MTHGTDDQESVSLSADIEVSNKNIKGVRIDLNQRFRNGGGHPHFKALLLQHRGRGSRIPSSAATKRRGLRVGGVKAIGVKAICRRGGKGGKRSVVEPGPVE